MQSTIKGNKTLTEMKSFPPSFFKEEGEWNKNTIIIE